MSYSSLTVIKRRTSQLFAAARSFAYTLFLFTYADYKTIFFPVTVFACVAAPVHSYTRLLHGLVWIWLHLLQCNVSNQYKSAMEDAINRPWRPIPSGRISSEQSPILRWTLVPLCIGLSACYGWDVALTSALLTTTMILYDECGFSGHWLGKNLCNIPGYVTFEIGSTKIMGSSTALDSTAMFAIACSGLVIFTTIQAQDFADVIGDRVLGRVTIPIWSPEGSRQFTLVALLAWSAFLTYVWTLGLTSSAILCILGMYVGYRYYAFRRVEDDEKSYVIYNIWLLFIHILPAHARWGVLAF